MDQGQVEILLKVIAILDRLDIPYVVGGSIASSIHGLPRTTNDADLLISLQLAKAPKLISELQREFYADDVAILRALRLNKSFNVIHEASLFKVDFFLSPGVGFEAKQLERRRAEMVAPETAAYVATPEDVILAKLRWYRKGNEVAERQWQDVQTVVREKEGQLDVQYLYEWAASLGISDLLERALAEAAPSSNT